MDEDEINYLIQRCVLLKHKFLGVFAANNLSQKLKPNSSLIDNAATSERFGTHWLLMCQKDTFFSVGPLGQSISSNEDVYQRIISLEKSKIYQLLEDQPIQNKNSKDFSFFCTYVADHILTHKNCKTEWCSIRSLGLSYDVLTFPWL